MAQTILVPVQRPTTPVNNRVSAFERECISCFSDVVQVFGMPRSVGQIYGLLYASPVPLSFSDLVERLEISKGSASQGLQLLRALGAIHLADQLEGRKFNYYCPRLSTPRREYFEPELSLRKLVSGVLHERIEPLATFGSERLCKLKKMAEHQSEGKIFYLERVKQLETWRRQLKMVLPVLNVVLGPASSK